MGGDKERHLPGACSQAGDPFAGVACGTKMQTWATASGETGTRNARQLDSTTHHRTRKDQEGPNHSTQHLARVLDPKPEDGGRF